MLPVTFMSYLNIDIQSLIEDLRAKMREHGLLTEVLYTLNKKGEIVAVKIRLTGQLN